MLALDHLMRMRAVPNYYQCTTKDKSKDTPNSQGGSRSSPSNFVSTGDDNKETLS